MKKMFFIYCCLIFIYAINCICWWLQNSWKRCPCFWSTSSFSKLYTFYSVSQPRNKTYCGETIHFTDDTIHVTINVASYADETGTDKDRFAEFIIAHEFGHVLGLADLGAWDTRDSVMSLYADKNESYKPSRNDFLGIQYVYDLPDAITYGIVGGGLDE